MAKLERQHGLEDGGGRIPLTAFLDREHMTEHQRATIELRLMRDLIERDGWLRGEWGNFDRGHCTVAAWRQVRGGMEALRRLLIAAGKQPPMLNIDGRRYYWSDYEHSCIAWNDECINSKAEALAWYDRAIALPE